MPSVLKNFLIGVGLDTKDYDGGAKRVESSLGRMRSLVGFTGSAIVGAFGAAGTAAVVAGKRVDDLALRTEKLKTSPQYVYDYGRALAAMGGQADDALTAINAIEEAQANLRLKGMLGPLEDVALARADISALTQTTNGKDFLRTLAPMVQGMNRDQQRLVQGALGLPDSVMRSLRDGVDQLDQAVARAHDLAGNFDDATAAARDFNEQLSEFNTRMEGLGNTLAQKILPGFTGVLQSMGGFIDEHQDMINRALGVAADNPGATALAGGGGAAATGGVLLRGLVPGTLGAAGARVAKFGSVGALIGAGLIAGDIAVNGLTDEQRKRLDEGGPLVHFGPDGSRDPADFLNGYRRAGAAADPTSLVDTPPTNPNAYGTVGPGLRLPPEPLPTNPNAWGYVTPAEAASVSPDVVMIRDQRQRSEQSAKPQRVTVQNHLQANLTLDGRALESKITDVVERREQATIDDMTSAVNR